MRRKELLRVLKLTLATWSRWEEMEDIDLYKNHMMGGLCNHFIQEFGYNSISYPYLVRWRPKTTYGTFWFQTGTNYGYQQRVIILEKAIAHYSNLNWYQRMLYPFKFINNL